MLIAMYKNLEYDYESILEYNPVSWPEIDKNWVRLSEPVEVTFVECARDILKETKFIDEEIKELFSKVGSLRGKKAELLSLTYEGK